MAEERPWNKDLLDKIINHEIICFNKTRKHSTSMPTFSGMESYLSSVNKQILLCSCDFESKRLRQAYKSTGNHPWPEAVPSFGSSPQLPGNLNHV
jgi:hypothetical protein